MSKNRASGFQLSKPTWNYLFFVQWQIYVSHFFILLKFAWAGKRDCAQRLECQTEGRCTEEAILSFTSASMEECIRQCASNPDCEWWTFDSDNNGCQLFSQCGTPEVGLCFECVYGQKRCPCKLNFGNEQNLAKYARYIPFCSDGHTLHSWRLL